MHRTWSLFGKLTLHAFVHDLVQNAAVIGMVVGGLLIVGLLFYFKRWKWLWKEWLTSVDPKKIGAMYFVVVLIMLLKGFMDAAMMRLQQVLAVGPSEGYLSAHHYQEIFSAHGITMIFFVAMGVVFGSMNLLVPLQIGARDVAFPFLNALSFWFFASGAALVLVSLAIGHFSIAGWLAYPPLSGLEYSPGEGVNYWIWILQIAGVGSTLSGINFLVTILRMRAPGMTLMRMPMFTWAALGTVVLVIFAFPILTATLGMLTLDRYIGSHFFTSGFGGNPMMYVNLIWAWGHPEVYILVLPAFGIFSEVVPTFSKKRLFGYVSMVWAIIAITILSFIVWLHHFFTMGASPSVNAFFGVMTMLIAIPTGVKIFNWLFTQYRGRVHLATPMLWFLAFVTVFTIGGMAGVLLSIPPVDFQVHNSLFLIAHFHSVIIGGTLFGFFSGYTFWFPKIAGFQLNDRLGRWAFWCWFIGFMAAFMPLYQLGLMGATRRLNHTEAEWGWAPFFWIAAVGAALIFIGIGLQILQIVVSVIQRRKNRDVTGDPWDGRTLEWATPSPPPFYNFAIQPTVTDRDMFWEVKQGHATPQPRAYEDLIVMKNTGVPVCMGGCATLFGFATTWEITWLGLLAFVGVLALLIYRLCRDQVYHVVSASEIAKLEAGRTGGLTFG